MAFVSNKRPVNDTSLVACTLRRPRNYQYDLPPALVGTSKLRADLPYVVENSTSKYATTAVAKHIKARDAYTSGEAARPGEGFPGSAIIGLVLFDGLVPKEMLKTEMYKHHSPDLLETPLEDQGLHQIWSLHLRFEVQNS